MRLSALMASSRLHSLRIAGSTQQERNILYFTIDTALQGLVMGGIFGFISVFVVRLGASNLMVSLVTSLPAIVLALASLPAGVIIGRQRDLVRFTNYIRIYHRGSFLIIALLPLLLQGRNLIVAIIVVWTVKSISAALLESSWMAVVADMIPAERRARVNGTRWAITSIVTAVATAVFGIILDRVAFPLNYQVVFMISFAGGIAGMIYFGKIRIPENVPPPRSESPIRQRLWDSARSMMVPAFISYEIAATVLRLGLNMPSALYSVYWIRNLGSSELWIGWQATVGKLALIIGYITWGRVVTRKGQRIPLLVCTTALGLYPVLTGLVPDQRWLPLVAIVQGFFSTGIDISFFETLLSVVPAGRRPPFIALNTFLMSVTVFIGPLIGSLLADRLDIRLVFFVAGGIHLAAALLFWKLRIGAR